MKILADENVPGEMVEALRQRGHDVRWIHADAPGGRDREILQRAQAEERLLLTFDKDFGELAFRLRLPSSSGPLFRIPVAAAIRMAGTLLEARTDWTGHFSVVEADRVRMTPLPPRARP